MPTCTCKFAEDIQLSLTKTGDVDRALYGILCDMETCFCEEEYQRYEKRYQCMNMKMSELMDAVHSALARLHDIEKSGRSSSHKSKGSSKRSVTSRSSGHSANKDKLYQMQEDAADDCHIRKPFCQE